jgi:hypothetical protein
VATDFDVHRIHEAAFGPPVHLDGHTLIPVARVAGGGGSLRLWPFGTSGGLVRARPLGVYRVDETGEQWLPAASGRRWTLGLLVLATAALAAALVRGRRSRREADETPSADR